MTIREDLRRVFVTLLGLAIAALFGFFEWLELKNGVQQAHTTHLVLDTVMIAIGFGIIAPDLFFSSAKKVVLVVIDAKKNGLRWSDPKEDSSSPPSIP